MALGKAFIEVHADTKPFARELGRELDKIIKDSEKTVRVRARKTGETFTKGVGEGIRKEGKTLKKDLKKVVESSLFGDNIFAKFAKGIIDTIDDGLSGLPDEVKVVLGGALIALLPVALAFGAGLASAIVAGVSLGGLAALGALIGAQIDSVEERFHTVTGNIQKQFASATEWLAGPIINAINLVDERFTKLLPSISRISQAAVATLGPLTDALLGLVEHALPGFERGLFGLQKFLPLLQSGFRRIGDALGRMFDHILNNPQALAFFFDLLGFVAQTITLLTDLVTIGLSVYGVFRKIGELFGVLPIEKILALAEVKYGPAAVSATGFGLAVEGTLNPLTQQAEVLEGINKELDTYTNLLFQSTENELDFQQQIIQLSDSVKENGRSLDTNTKAGQANARILLAMAHNAVETRKTQIELTGDVVNSQIEFEAQRKKIYEVSKQMGLSEAATKNLIGSLLLIPPPKATGVDQASISRLNNLNDLLAQAQVKLRGLISIGLNAGIANIQAHANGGVFNSPHVGMVAEAGPEAIIPLNRPARAAQIMNQSGLSSMITPSVNVYIGNQQIDAYIDQRVNGAMRGLSRSLSYGSRAV